LLLRKRAARARIGASEALILHWRMLATGENAAAKGLRLSMRAITCHPACRNRWEMTVRPINPRRPSRMYILFDAGPNSRTDKGLCSVGIAKASK
jgi:hypothetical protein